MASKTKKPIARPYKPVDVVNVHVWGQHAGAVALDPSLGYCVFAYTPEFASRRFELSPLQMPVGQGGRSFVFTDLPEPTFKHLPALLADALPDDFGNALIDRYMAERGIPKARITPLDRLAYMGQRAMGALEFQPAKGPTSKKATAIELASLVVAARSAVYGSLDTDTDTHAVLRSILDVGTSAGGARAKAVVAWNPLTSELRSGQVDAPPGFEHWLLKFDGMGRDFELGSSQDYGRIEYAYHLMARAAGICMTECRLLKENGRAHFMTRRFDREGSNTKHHMQTLCAMSHIDYKKKGTNGYAQLFMTIKELHLAHADMKEAFRRMVFNVMARNCDDHSKNFAFRLRQGQAWELAPAYDVTFAHNPLGEWTAQHLMSVNGKFRNITADDMLAEAERFGVGEAPLLMEQVRQAVQQWPEFAERAGISEVETNRIRGLLWPNT